MNLEAIKFLNQLKNASIGNIPMFKTKSNRLILGMLNLLKNEGFILSFRKQSRENYLNETSDFFVYMNPTDRQFFADLKIVSTLNRPKYYSLNAINRMDTKKKLMVFSTDKGFLTLTDCRQHRVGGVLLFIS